MPLGLFDAYLSLLLVIFPQVSRSSSTFNAGIINFVTSEGAAIGDVVGTLDSSDLSENTKNHDEAPWFVLQDTTYFKLDGPGQRNVVVNRILDRDNDRKLCREPTWPETCAWSGVIFARDGVFLSLRITVLDINDNAPRWPESALSRPRNEPDKVPAIELFIAENIPLDSTFDLPLAEDRDYGKNGIENYELLKIDENGLFSLHCSDGPNGVIPRLRVLGKLDREEKEEHELRISAVDGGGQRAVEKLRVYVSDENDNPPIFTHLANLSNDEARRTRFVIEIDESTPVGTTLPLKPVATDADAGEFGRVRYRFSFSTPEFVRRDFAIDADTGSIIVQNTLDCDTGGFSEYVFSLIAEDSAPQPQTALATVVIILHDANDNAPIITLTPASLKFGDSYDSSFFPRLEDIRDTFCLIEEMPPGQLVATVEVTDPDADANGEFNCELGGSMDFSLRALPWVGTNKVYQLLAARRFDRETEVITSVRIECVDRGNPPKVSSKIIPITLIDINDNGPQFEQSIYTFSIAENQDPGDVIGRVMVQDTDAGSNGEVEFSIAWKNPTQQHPFSINKQGEIIANDMFDREVTPHGFRFNVIAEDRGRPTNRASSEITIQIEDVNDCLPKFALQEYHFSIDEDIEPYKQEQRPVGNVFATDCDVGPNAKILYYLEERNSPFEISSNGTIYAVQRIDRETTSAYILTVVAQDSPLQSRPQSLALSSSIQVHIIVTDLNDHAPVFIFPRLNVSAHNLPEIKVSSMEPLGHRIAKFQAKDPDAGLNAAILYLLKPTDSDSKVAGLFYLAEESGELLVASKLPTSGQMNYRISVVAKDKGVPARSSTLQLLITVDTSLPPTPSGSNRGGGENGDVMTNIYLITFITFGVVISFVILIVAICFMSPTSRERAICCGSGGRIKASRVKGNGESVDFSVPGGPRGEGSVMAFGNGVDYVGTAGSTTYTLEKGSPIQYAPSEDTQTPHMGGLPMNSYYDPSFMNPVYNSTIISRHPSGDEAPPHVDPNNIINDATSMTTFDRYSSLGRMVPPIRYTPQSPGPTNYHLEYLTNHPQTISRQMNGDGGYSWCDSRTKMRTHLSPNKSHAWAS